MLNIPNQVTEIINRLYAHTYKSYIVGKCVRELILGQNAVDFDIITDAPIERILKIFEAYSMNIEHIKRGEVIVHVLGMGIQIAPYRRAFTESGGPIYTTDIFEDLANRDFSFNAIAYNEREGFIDPFGGLQCLKGEIPIVEAIGEHCYETDTKITSTFVRNPVSILLALGYYSTGDFIIADATKEGILRNADLVKTISADNIRIELSWVLRGKRISHVLEEYQNIFTALIPEFSMLEGVPYNRVEHQFDMLTHTNKSVGYSSPILTLRYAMLFHALGDPDCRSTDTKGKAHYYGHGVRSAIYAKRIMTRLGFKAEDIREVCFIIEHQEDEIGVDRRSMKLQMQKMSPDKLKLLLQFKYADLRAQSPEFEGAAGAYKRLVDAVNEITALKECYSLNQLAINKYDLIQMRIVSTDEEARVILQRLLDIVIDAPIYNTKNRLLDIAARSVKTNIK